MIRAIKEPIYQLTYFIYTNVEKGSTVIDRYCITTLITQWTDFTNHNPVTFRQDMFNDALASICHCQPIRLLIVLATTQSAGIYHPNT